MRDEVTDRRILTAARDEQLYLYNGRLWFNGNTYQVPRRRVQALRAAGLVRLEPAPGRRRWLLTERGKRLLAHGTPDLSSGPVVLFGPPSQSVLHRPDEWLAGVTACRQAVPSGAVTMPRREALLSALAYGIPRCVTCYPDHQIRREGAGSG